MGTEAVEIRSGLTEHLLQAPDAGGDRFTAVRLSGGTQHEHIVRLWWVNPANGKTGDNSRGELVSWIENENGKAYVEDQSGHRADVYLVMPRLGAEYLRTKKDGVWTNNLLALPRR